MKSDKKLTIFEWLKLSAIICSITIYVGIVTLLKGLYAISNATWRHTLAVFARNN